MNELQIRLSADISALQSALTKAKNTIKSFESETEKESEKGNVGFKRKIGLIEQLTNKAKALRTALSQATNEQQIERYNQELEQTSRELTRLNALGRSVTANLGSTASGFGQVARQGANANGVAIEFNRIIQDAPFGLIGIGNNLQQLAGNFAQVSKQAGGTGKAIAASLSSIVSPVNLGLLAISALTAGFTAYQMGAFDGIFATKDLSKASEEAAEKLEKYREGLDAVTRANIEGAGQGEKEVQTFELLRAQAENANIPLKDRIKAVKELKSEYPDYLNKLTNEKILTGDVGNAYKNLTNEIIATAKARAFSDRIAENQLQRFTLEERAANRVNDILKARDEFTKAGESVYDVGEIEIIKQIKDLTEEQLNDVNEINRLKEEEEKLTGKINDQISKGARFTEDKTKKVKDLSGSYDSVLKTVELISEIEVGAEKQIKSLDFVSVLKSELSVLQGALSQAFEFGSIDEVEGIQKKIDNINQILSNFSKDVKEVPLQIDFKPEVVKEQKGAIQELEQLLSVYKSIIDTTFDPEIIEKYNLKIQQTGLVLKTLKESGTQDITSFADVLGESFMSLGNQIAQATGLAATGFQGFVRTILTNAPKIIQAILTQAKAQKAAAALANEANVSQATGAAIVTAAEGAKGLGPVGIIALPALIAGAVALVSGAFGKASGGSVSGGVGASIGRPPQIFTNSQIPSIPSSPAPSPSGNIDFDRAQGTLTTRVDGGDIVFVYDRYKERQQGGG